MYRIFEFCCGIDIQNRSILACFKCGENQILRSFATTIDGQQDLINWLTLEKCQMIAVNNAVPYWKFLYNTLKTSALRVIAVNAQSMKDAPGYKNNVQDSEWIADFLQYGFSRVSQIDQV